MQTLNDYIEDGLEILSIGLNPSPPSVLAGLYFAGKRNRFWLALNESGLVDQRLEPSLESMQQLLNDYKIGFTDTVKRPTPGAGGLSRADYVRDVPLLQKKIMHYQPLIAWFHGKVAYKNYLSVLNLDNSQVQWGAQELRIGRSRVFVCPNPSPANAVFSLPDLVIYYQQLKDWRDELK
jgi:TDG/mug DNA glycosylase family protein